MKTELHLIVLWQKARFKEKEILADIGSNLMIRQIYEIKWTPSLVSENFSRFYGTKLPPHSGKERDVGTGSFLCVIVEDKKPHYQFMETSRGHEYVNQNIFTLKLKYRSWVGGSRIHTTNTIQETNHDSVLLLGYNYEDLGKILPEKWDGKIEKNYRDITGATGWKNLSQLFYVLNATTDYVVLRNYEILPEQFKSDLHGDIDILTTNYQNLKFILNAVSVFSEKYRVHCYSRVGKEKVFFDFRYLKDGYYCNQFENDILRGRILNEKGIYVPSVEYSFYSLIYHALIHKRKIASDYYEKIHHLFLKLELDKKYDISKYDNPFDLYFQLLEKFMDRHCYNFTKPLDKSVFYSEKLVQIQEVRPFLRQNYKITDVYPVQSHLIGGNGSLFLTGIFENKKVFLKVGWHKGIYKNEYKSAKELYDLDPDHFVKPLLWRENDDLSFVALEYVSGISLDRFLQTNPLATVKAKIVEDLFQIFLDLKLSHIVHRDIRPQNFMVQGEHLKLIDCQLAVSKENYNELDYLIQNDLWTGLGEDYAVKSGIWDDAYSLLKVLEFIGSDPLYQEDYQKIYGVISNYIGHDRVVYNRSACKHFWFKMILYKIKSKFSLTHEKRKKYRQKYKKVKGNFSFFQKIKTESGKRKIYILGVRVLSYKRK